MIPLSQAAYKIPINSGNLVPTLSGWFKAATHRDKLLEALGWEAFPEGLEAGFEPVKNVGELKKLLADMEKREALHRKRVGAGFPSMITPRKGLAGLIQKWFRDGKEPRLPTEVDVLQWVDHCPRYQLLVSMRDFLLQSVALADPIPVTLEDIVRFPHPVGDWVGTCDKKRAAKFCQLLSAPLKKVQPEMVLSEVSGFVVAYDAPRSFAYYYS
jgi:hypothetical protein